MESTMVTLTVEEIWQALEEVKDPEIPVVSLVEMGIIRRVEVSGGTIVVSMTPTFAGCPALHVMKAEVEQRLREMGAESVETKWVYSPPWTSDWIADEARAKLKAFGLAPPVKHSGDVNLILLEEAACPYCGSRNTTIKNTFGPTLCRAIYYCDDCRQPFEQFKPL